MIRHPARLVALAAPVLFLGCAPAAGPRRTSAAGRPGAFRGPPAASGPSVDGAFQLAYPAPNAGMITGPPMGVWLWAFTGRYYNVNVVEDDAAD